jgi:hypothetical protein
MSRNAMVTLMYHGHKPIDLRVHRIQSESCIKTITFKQVIEDLSKDVKQ